MMNIRITLYVVEEEWSGDTEEKEKGVGRVERSRRRNTIKR